MTDGGSDFTCSEKLARKRSIDRVRSEIQDRSVSADVEDTVVVLDVDLAEFLGGSELSLDGLIFAELVGPFVLEHLDMRRINLYYQFEVKKYTRWMRLRPRVGWDP